MVSFEIPLIFGILLFIIHYYTDNIKDFYLKSKRSISAFSGGIVLSYLALHIFPAVYQVQGRLSKVAFVSILAGLALFFAVDRHISKHKMAYKIKAETREEHAVALFVYHILIGIAFITFSENLPNLILFFVPVALFTAFSPLSMREIYDIEKESSILKGILSASTLIGIMLAMLIPISRLLYFPLLGFLGGSILYLILNDIARNGEKKSAYFIWGLVLYTGIIGAIWVMF